jgi:S1-C subfamily serine protease
MAADSPLDSYSQIVTAVAAALTPKVASLRVPRAGGRGGGESLGSAVVYTGDGFLLTNAHVVGRASGGTALFSDGTSAAFTVVGADSLSDLAVVRAGGPVPSPVELGEADQLVVITVMRNGALVDVIAEPSELIAA